MSEPKVGLITVTYNSSEVLADFIDSVNELNYSNYHLYVIDNASTDSSLAILAATDDQKTTIIANKENNGVAKGNNQGIEAALHDYCEYVILINNDTKFEKGLISKLLAASKKCGDALVAPKMMYYDEPDIIWFGGGYFNKRQGNLNYHVGVGQKDIGQFKSYTKIDYAPTCCTLVPVQVFNSIGLMDEKYFVYYDDTDWFYRLKRDGRFKMVFLNEIEFYHKVGRLTKSKKGTRSNFKFSDFSVRYMTRNRVYYLRKQGTPLSYGYLIYFYFRVIARFLFSGKYHKDFRTLILLQKSFFDGLVL